MKASNGGVLHTLFDYSHPHLLGCSPRRPTSSRSRTPLAPTTPRHPQPQEEPQPNGYYSPVGHSRKPSDTFSKQGTSPRGDGGDSSDTASGVSGSSLGGQGGHGHGRDSRRARALGRRLPRTLVVHGTADATVPFSQTAAVGAALRTLGVPTVVRYDQGGEREREADIYLGQLGVRVLPLL